MKLNQEAIEDIQTLINDLKNDIFAVDNSHPMSEGRFKDVYTSINQALSILREREEELKKPRPFPGMENRGIV